MLAAKTSAAGARRMRIMTFPPSARRSPRAPCKILVRCPRDCLGARRARSHLARSLGRAAGWTRPAIGQRVVGLLGVDPNLSARLLARLAGRKFDLLPERRTGLEVIHQEFGGGESIVAVGGGGDDEDDVLAGQDPAIAVDHGDAE